MFKYNLVNKSVAKDKIILKSKDITFIKKKIKLIYSFSIYNGQSTKFKNNFKKQFNLSLPNISEYSKLDKITVLWIRDNSYFVCSDFNLKKKFEKTVKSFYSLASITDQSGGWASFFIEGSLKKMLLEKMINIDYNKLSEKSVISTSFYGIRCLFVNNLNINKLEVLCPISFSDSIEKKLLNVINFTKAVQSNY